MRNEQLKERTRKFALEIIGLVENLTKSRIADTLLSPVVLKERNMFCRYSKYETDRNGRAVGSTASAGGKAYVVGGSPSVSAYGGVSAIVKEYDPASDAWFGRTSLSMSRAALAAVSIDDNTILALGGYGGDPYAAATVEEYTPKSIHYIYRRD